MVSARPEIFVGARPPPALVPIAYPALEESDKGTDWEPMIVNGKPAEPSDSYPWVAALVTLSNVRTYNILHCRSLTFTHLTFALSFSSM